MKSIISIVLLFALFLITSACDTKCWETRCINATNKCANRRFPFPSSRANCDACILTCTRASLRIVNGAKRARKRARDCNSTKSFYITVACRNAAILCAERNSKGLCHNCVNTCTWTQVIRFKNRRRRVRVAKNKCGQLAKTKRFA